VNALCAETGPEVGRFSFQRHDFTERIVGLRDARGPENKTFLFCFKITQGPIKNWGNRSCWSSGTHVDTDCRGLLVMGAIGYNFKVAWSITLQP